MRGWRDQELRFYYEDPTWIGVDLHENDSVRNLFIFNTIRSFYWEPIKILKVNYGVIKVKKK